jgi:hypothetical protein
MGNPSLDPETALQLYRAVLYFMAYIFAGVAVIALSVYIVLVCSEMFFSQPRSKTRSAKPSEYACRVPVPEQTLDPSADETVILTASARLAKGARVATLQSAPTGL